MTFRRRIIVAMIPLFMLLAVLGGTTIVLLYYLGGRIDAIFRENYDSVVYMRNLNEALERIDSSFQFALAGREKNPPSNTRIIGTLYETDLVKEQHNITLPGEKEIWSSSLTALSKQYRQQATCSSPAPIRNAMRSTSAQADQPGLYSTFQDIKRSRATSCRSTRTTWSSQPGGTPLGPLLAVLVRRRPGLRHRVGRVSDRQHDPHDPVSGPGGDRIGHGDRGRRPRSARADHFRRRVGPTGRRFNTMARQLRDFRQSHKAQLIRAHSRPARPRSIRSPIRCWWSIQQQHVEMANPAARRLLGVRAARGGRGPPTGLGAARAAAAAAGRGLAEPARISARGLRQGRRAANRRGNALLPAADPADPRCRRRDAGRRRAAGRRHPLPAAGRSEEQPGGHGQPRVEDAADQHPPGAAPALGGERSGRWRPSNWNCWSTPATTPSGCWR